MIRRLSLFLALLASSLMAQQERQLFDAPLVVLAADSVPFTHIADVDGDPYPDYFGHALYAGTAYPVQRVAVWRGQPDGGVELLGTQSLGVATSNPSPQKAAVADFGG